MNSRLEHIQRMLKEEPNEPFLLYAAALELRKAGKTDEALSWFQNLHKVHPDYLPNYYQLGTLLEETGAHKEALDIYKEGVVLASGRGEDKTRAELSERHSQLADMLE
jgi:tetratricopeptide (TPR) repeat protein